MIKLLVGGIAMLMVGNAMHIAGLSDIGTLLIAIAVGWAIVKTVAKVSGKPKTEEAVYPYEYHGKRFRTERERNLYKNDFIEATRMNDTRF